MLKRLYAKIKQSRIWRYTLPLRKIGWQVRRLAKAFKKRLKDTLKKFKSMKIFKKKKKKMNPLKMLRSVQPRNIDELKTEYHTKGLDNVSDTFVLYRIIGNDLYPRHKKGQSRENLQFVLENEPDLENCDKQWIVNRIIDHEEEKAVIELLEKHEQQFIHIPFRLEEYQNINWDTDCFPEPAYLASVKFQKLDSAQRNRAIEATYRLKNNYVMNNNGARNVALRAGKERAKWVLPWDGNCFITHSAWKQICEDVTAKPYLKYFVVPMTRITDNNQLPLDTLTPDPVEEPQVIFRSDSNEEFNEQFCYGRRPKVEFFWRLGIPGKWDNWLDFPWDQQRRSLSPEASQFGVAGWVARMFSGMGTLEQDNEKSFKDRGFARLDAIVTTLRQVDSLLAGKSADSNTLTSFQSDILDEEVSQYKNKQCSFLMSLIEEHLLSDAEESLQREPYAVTDKTTLPPSGLLNDYWHPAPYWWPNPDTEDGLPYIRRDGERVPGTRMYEADSEKYDRTRVQRVFDDSIILALAWKYSGNMKYAEHAARIFERFFINPNTRMNPHLKYAQVKMGHNGNVGGNIGIIEFKDMYYYLDAVRLLTASGAISETYNAIFNEWLSSYLEWLLRSKQGKNECKAQNNHGTYYDLQVAAIAAFLNNHSVLYETLARAQSRIKQQFAPDGSQPDELTRNTTAHYCCFNFQGWVNLSKIARQWGSDLWSYKAPNGANLVKGSEWLLAHIGLEWPYEQIDTFDADRFYPILFALQGESSHVSRDVDRPGSKYQVKPRFFPHDGIQPYWNLGKGEGTIK